MNGGRSAAHSSYAEKLYLSLIERMGSLGINARDNRLIARAFQDGNVDGLRCLDKFMTSNSPRIVFNILLCQLVVANRLGKKGVEFLTQEMLDASARVYRGEIKSKFEIPDNKNLMAFMFKNMDRIEEIFSLIEDDGIADSSEIEAIICAPSSIPKSLRNGAL